MVNKTIENVILYDLIKHGPFDFVDLIKNKVEGGNLILAYLSKISFDVSAGKLARVLKVSTARIAVLLKKLVKNNLIKKYSNPDDARITMVSLTEKGKHFITNEFETTLKSLKKIIDKIGLKDLEEFIRISRLINEVALTN